MSLNYNLFVLLVFITILKSYVSSTRSSGGAKYISKCCKSTQVLIKIDSYKCKKPSVNVKYPFVPVYNSYQIQKKKNASEIFRFLDKKLADVKFIEYADDYSKEFQHYLIEDGSLLLVAREVNIKPIKADNESFCFDYILDNKTNKLEIFYLSIVEQPAETPKITTFALIISCVFLTLVLLVYIVLPELRNIGGLVLMSCVFCLLNFELFLFIIRITEYSRKFCTFSTYYIYFFNIAYYCWVNILSFDIWSIFKGFAKYHTLNIRKQRKKYVLYCVYGLGVPSVMTMLLYILDNVDFSNYSSFKPPGLKFAPCFLAPEQKFLYLHIPTSILIGINVVLFLWTAYYYWSHSQQESVVHRNDLKSNNRRQSERLWMYLKLFAVMGISWILEVVSALVPDWSMWYITDLYNAFSGIMIFIIFVCKKKIILKFKKKIHCGKSGKTVDRLNVGDSLLDSSQDSVVNKPVSLNPNGKINVEHH